LNQQYSRRLRKCSKQTTLFCSSRARSECECTRRSLSSRALSAHEELKEVDDNEAEWYRSMVPAQFTTTGIGDSAPRHAIPFLASFVAWCLLGLCYGLILFFHRRDGSFGTEFSAPQFAAILMGVMGCNMSAVQTLRSIRAIRNEDAGTLKWTPRLLTLHTTIFTIASIVLLVVTYKGYRPVAVASAIHICLQVPFAATVIVTLWRYRVHLLARSDVKAAVGV
jgi:hypothetical protein